MPPTNSSNSRRGWWAVAAVILLGFPSSGFCCEPILPVSQLLAGSTVAGPAILLNSWLWLAAAVALKAGAFVFLERRISWQRGAVFMILANIVSTVPGLLVAVFASSGSGVGILLTIPIMLVLGAAVQRRARRLTTVPKPLSIFTNYAAIAFVGVFYLSAVLHYVAAEILEHQNYASYWLTKFVFVTLVACTGILISAVLEECAIVWFHRDQVGPLSFYVSVLRANYITLGAVLFVAAVKILPQRFNAPHFITSWLDGVLSALGNT